MMTNQVEVIEKDGQPTHAVVPIDLYRRLLALAEDAEDIRAANEALDELAAGQDELVPAEVAHKLLQDEEHRLRIWREHRGLTQTELGAISGVQQGYIAQIESGKKTGSIETLKKLSAALRIDIDDLVAARMGTG